MIEIIVLIFLTRRIGQQAVKKGLKPVSWKLFTVAAWIMAELAGCLLAALFFGKANLIAILSIGLFSAFGGYLIVKAMLEKRPDLLDNDINRIGVDDLHPPKNQ